MRITYTSDGSAGQAVEALGRKLSLLEGAQSEASSRKTVEVFGQPLTPMEVVRTIVAAVRERGDEALFEYALRIDGVGLSSETVRLGREEIASAKRLVPAGLMELVRRAAGRVRRFQAHILPVERKPLELAGTKLGLRILPYRRIGVCIPGWSAILPSSLVMTVVPAKVAGVEEIAVVTPARKDGSVAPAILATCAELGIDEVYKVGGAQAVAALAFGTESIRRVDKVVGPGNIFVTLAKKEVFGQVDIDMLAGPSEVVVVADRSASARLVAADMISQAEHGPGTAVLVTDSEKLAHQVVDQIERQVLELPRAALIRKCLDDYGFIIVTRDIDEATRLSNQLAPEHLEIQTERPGEILEKIRNAGAVFLGRYCPVAVGDYMAGPSHVLPTGGSARYFSGLSAADFLRSMSVIECSRKGLSGLAEDVIEWANIEALTAHARSVELRTKDNDTDTTA